MERVKYVRLLLRPFVKLEDCPVTVLVSRTHRTPLPEILITCHAVLLQEGFPHVSFPHMRETSALQAAF